MGRFAILAVALLVTPVSSSADRSAATREAVAVMRRGDIVGGKDAAVRSRSASR